MISRDKMEDLKTTLELIYKNSLNIESDIEYCMSDIDPKDGEAIQDYIDTITHKNSVTIKLLMYIMRLLEGEIGGEENE